MASRRPTGQHRALSDAGRAAALRVAGELGLPTTDPRVLSERGNLLVHLAPAPVLARVATLTAWTRRDPAAWLAREVAVAGWAAARGGPVVAPSALVPPGPHHAGGFVLTFWEHRVTVPRRAHGTELGAALARLHIAADGHPGLPWLAPVREQVDDALHALERDRVLDGDLLVALQARHADVLAGLAGAGSADIVLHGDAHAGNLLCCAGPGGADEWLWSDLEETCTGPPEWDLAVLAGGPGADATAVLAGYAEVAGRPIPRPAELAPFRRARELEAAVWLLAMAHLHPERYRALAAERLAALRLTS